jgi:hypothetical protein
MKEQQINIEYWKSLWAILIDSFSAETFGISLYSPQILIDDIITEIEENNFNSKENRNFLYARINEYCKGKKIPQSINTDFEILRRNFSKNRIGYILKIAKQIKTQLDSGSYFNYLLEQLVCLLTKSNKIDDAYVESLNFNTKGIIVEFLKKGYDIEDIKNILTDIFDDYEIQKNTNKLSTNFPHPVDREKYKDVTGKINRVEYNNAIKDFFETLNLEKRIRTLKVYYYKEKRIAYYIFAIEGLVGKNELTIGDVTFYSIDEKRFLKSIENNLEKFDVENLQTKHKEKFQQAIVKVDYLLPKSSLNSALLKVERALNLMSCYYKPKAGFETNDSNYIILDKNYRVIYSSTSADKRDSFFKYFESLKVDNYFENLKKLNEYSQPFREKNPNNLKVLNAMHWFRKASNSTRKEDKLLNFWISLENLFTDYKDLNTDILNNAQSCKIQLIQELITANQLIEFRFKYGWELHRYYSSYTNRLFIHHNKFPDEFLIKSGLKAEEGATIYLNDFIKNLDELLSYEDNPYMIYQIKKLKDFYHNKDFTIVKFKEFELQIKNEILMIYRLRNLIVHNAQYDYTLLPYFTWKIESLTGNFIRKIISERNNGNNDFRDILIGIYYEKEKLINDIKNKSIDLLKD